MIADIDIYFPHHAFIVMVLLVWDSQMVACCTRVPSNLDTIFRPGLWDGYDGRLLHL
jgi:hypothetical protein